MFSPCVYLRRSHHTYQIVVATRSLRWTSATSGHMVLLDNRRSASTEPPSLSIVQISFTSSCSPRICQISCTLGHRNIACLMLSQSELQRGHWELVVICLFAKTPRQGIAPSKVLQTWILIFDGTRNFQMVRETGLVLEACNEFVVLNFRPCWCSHSSW